MKIDSMTIQKLNNKRLLGLYGKLKFEMGIYHSIVDDMMQAGVPSAGFLSVQVKQEKEAKLIEKEILKRTGDKQ